MLEIRRLPSCTNHTVKRAHTRTKRKKQNEFRHLSNGKSIAKRPNTCMQHVSGQFAGAFNGHANNKRANDFSSSAVAFLIMFRIQLAERTEKVRKERWHWSDCKNAKQPNCYHLKSTAVFKSLGRMQHTFHLFRIVSYDFQWQRKCKSIGTHRHWMCRQSLVKSNRRTCAIQSHLCFNSNSIFLVCAILSRFVSAFVTGRNGSPMLN